MKLHIQQHQKLAMGITDKSHINDGLSHREHVQSKNKISLNNDIQNQSANVNFKGGFFKPKNPQKFYTSKGMKKFVELTNNPALLEAVAAIGFAGILRPVTIMATKGEKRDKQYAAGHSMSSAVCGYLATLAVFGPIAKATEQATFKIKNSKSTKESAKNAKQMIKENQGVFKQIGKYGPKLFLQPVVAAFTIATIPLIMKKIFPAQHAAKHGKKNQIEEKSDKVNNQKDSKTVFTSRINKNLSPEANETFKNFTGHKNLAFSGGFKSVISDASKAWKRSRKESDSNILSSVQEYMGAYITPLIKKVGEAKPIQKFAKFVSDGPKGPVSQEKKNKYIEKRMKNLNKELKYYNQKMSPKELADEKEKFGKKYEEKHKDKFFRIFNQALTLTSAGLGTMVYTNKTMKSKDIEPERKKTLAANQAITWGLSAVGGILTDNIIFDKFSQVGEKYEKYNKMEIEEKFKNGTLAKGENEKKFKDFIKNAEEKVKSSPLDKQLEAFKDERITKLKRKSSTMGRNAATMIAFTLIYRYLTPVIATPLADFWKNHISKDPHNTSEKKAA